MGNIITLTEDDILSLSNNSKREVFLKQQNEIWIEVPELELKFVKITLPNTEKTIIITIYKSQYYDHDVRDYRITEQKNPYSIYDQNIGQVVDLLKTLSKSIKETRKKESDNGCSGSRISICDPAVTNQQA